MQAPESLPRSKPCAICTLGRRSSSDATSWIPPREFSPRFAILVSLLVAVALTDSCDLHPASCLRALPARLPAVGAQGRSHPGHFAQSWRLCRHRHQSLGAGRPDQRPVRLARVPAGSPLPPDDRTRRECLLPGPSNTELIDWRSQEYFALLTVADLALTTSIRDGMNTTTCVSSTWLSRTALTGPLPVWSTSSARRRHEDLSSSRNSLESRQLSTRPSRSTPGTSECVQISSFVPAARLLSSSGRRACDRPVPHHAPV